MRLYLLFPRTEFSALDDRALEIVKRDGCQNFIVGGMITTPTKPVG